MSDVISLLNELGVIVSTICPEIDSDKLMTRLEEVVGRYHIEKRSLSHLEADLLDNIRLYISVKRLEGLSELTLEDYFRELVSFEQFIGKPTVQIRTADIRLYLASNDKVMLSTSGKRLSVIKSFFAWLVDEEILLRNPAARIKQMKQPKRLPKALTAHELEVMRAACNSNRERALLEVLYSTGCRLSEITGMLRKDINWVDRSITVIGKGDKERIVYLNPKALYHLEAYLEECIHEENSCEHIFSTIRRPYRQMNNRTVQDIVNNIASRSTIDKKVTPHMFRHTMATLAMANGIELGDLQQLLGHENPGTTLRYAVVSEGRKHSAHKRFVN